MSAPNPPAAPAWVQALSGARIVSGAAVEAHGITHDSRQVSPGDIFVAIPGASADGNAFIEAALEAGAVAVIVEADLRGRWHDELDDRAFFVAVPDARAALAEAAAGLYGFPARSLGMVGVTGTDGKTTTTHLIAHVLTACGLRSGYLSSVAFSDGATTTLNTSHMTTVEASGVQRELRRAADAGARYAAVEASSIGLDLHRVDCCEFDVAVFTNLTPDHLDFHGTMDAYAASKATLFRMVAQSRDKGLPKAAIVCADDPAASVMLAAAPGIRAVRYGLSGEVDIAATDVQQDADGQRFTVRTREGDVAARTPLVGTYNVANSLAAIAVASSQGIALADAAAALESFPGVPGRMERIDEGQPFRVFVDIASTEPAMRNVLHALRASSGGRIIVVFGAAGERDVGRRSGIARAVAESADFAVLANEDPRREDPDAIIAEIAQALASAGWREGEQFVREPDRRRAMALAFERAAPRDTVLLAGKGTEPSIVMTTEQLPWDERAIARELLRAAPRV